MRACLTREIVAALQSGHLSIEERAEAKKHLDSCPSCRLLVVAGPDLGETVAPSWSGATSTSAESRVRINPFVATISVAAPILGERYQILSEVGHGGMGVVYRALDRLSGQHVALKCVSLPPPRRPAMSQGSHPAELGATLPASEEPVPFAATLLPDSGRPSVSLSLTEAEMALRLALAQEFKTLASLRHPNIVSVLDYGFDQNGAPFFTMELLTKADTLLSLVGESLQKRVGLLLQILQALVYLHRRGVLHRDIKPANILVVDHTAGRQVKLLDFGVSLLKASRAMELGEVAGTLGYIAPEVLVGEAASEAADLYSFGVVACELLTGMSPFNEQSAAALLTAALRGDPTWNEALLPQSLNQVLRCLLAKTSSARYPAAEVAAAALAESVGLPAPLESKAARESFLQAAEFIGRDTEFHTLREALGSAGCAWLVGGESGVGKSRLLDELRIWALVHGVLVLRGQADRDGTTGLGLFVEPLRLLCLEVTLGPLEACVLKSLVPDLPSLLGREIFDAPVLDGSATRLRLLQVLRSVLLRAKRRSLLLLEDLQWADPDSIELLKLLTPQVADSQLVFVGSYRQDERPSLPASLPDTRVLQLSRLDLASVRKLSASMLGAAEPSPSVLELLWRETEGNTFFLIEVTRALAEEAGSLAAVGQRQLPSQLAVGGIDAVLQRRLQRVPEPSQPLLRLAAVAGRQLDLIVLRAFHTDLEDWLRTCADVTVLEVSDQQWRFSHDKLRERLLREISPGELRHLHRQLAEALEGVYPGLDQHAARIGYHFEQAGELQLAVHYLARGGEVAVRRGALAEAASVLTRAQSLQKQLDLAPTARFRVNQLLAYALMGLSDLEACAAVFHETLALAGREMPKGRLGLTLGLLGQLGQQGLHRLHPGLIRPPGSSQEGDQLRELVNLHMAGLQLSAYRGKTLAAAHSALEALNLSERHGDASLRTIGYAGMGYLLTLTPLKSLGRSYLERGHRLERETAGTAALDYLLRGTALSCQSVGDQQRSASFADRAVALAEELGDVHSGLHARLIRMLAALFQGDYPAALNLVEALWERSIQSRNHFYMASAQGIRGGIAMRMGNLDQARTDLNQALEFAKTQQDTSLPVYLNCISVLCDMRRGAVDQAIHALPAALRLVEAAELAVHHCLDGYPAVVEVCLLAWQRATEPGDKTRLHRMYSRAMRALRRYALIFPIGRPALHLLTGRYRLALGQKGAALRSLRTAQQQAQAIGMAHEATLAAAWHGKATGGWAGRMELESANARLRALGAAELA